MKKFIPIIAIAIFIVAFYFSGLWRYFTWHHLKLHHGVIKTFVQAHPVLSPLIFMGIYIAYGALALPGIVFLSLLCGYFFKEPYSTLYIIFSATCGASLLFLAARSAFGGVLHERGKPFFIKMERNFEANQVSYLLFLRLAHIFPFWLVNIAPALFRVRFQTFLWTTAVGVIPGAFVDTQAGAGLDTFFHQPEKFSLEALFNPQMKIALICLGVFALVPIFLKRYFHR